MAPIYDPNVERVHWFEYLTASGFLWVIYIRGTDNAAYNYARKMLGYVDISGHCDDRQVQALKVLNYPVYDVPKPQRKRSSNPATPSQKA